VGLIQRAIEASGVATVSVSVLRDVTARLRLPRAVALRWPFGHVLGEPGARAQQLTVIRDALATLYTATPGTLVSLPYRWRRETYRVPDRWEVEPASAGATLGLEDRPDRAGAGDAGEAPRG
jgi:hypothetical protein